MSLNKFEAVTSRFNAEELMERYVIDEDLHKEHLMVLIDHEKKVKALEDELYKTVTAWWRKVDKVLNINSDKHLYGFNPETGEIFRPTEEAMRERGYTGPVTRN